MLIHYRNQSSAWMNAGILSYWFKNIFLEEIRREREETGSKGKVVLLLDNAPVYPKALELNKIDLTVEVHHFVSKNHYDMLFIT